MLANVFFVYSNRLFSFQTNLYVLTIAGKFAIFDVPFLPSQASSLQNYSDMTLHKNSANAYKYMYNSCGIMIVSTYPQKYA